MKPVFDSHLIVAMTVTKSNRNEVFLQRDGGKQTVETVNTRDKQI